MKDTQILQMISKRLKRLDTHREKMRKKKFERKYRQVTVEALQGSRYSGAWLRNIRAIKGVGRPVI